jgi:hypothetical protein
VTGRHGIVRRVAFVLAATPLLAIVGVAAATTPSPVQVTVTPKAPYPGDVVLVHVQGAPAGAGVEWGGRPITVFPVRDGAAGLVGIDLDTVPGLVAWRVVSPPGTPGNGLRMSGTVTVRPRTFPVQRLTFPPSQVDLDPPTLARVEREQLELKAALADSVADRLWRGAFRVPVEGGRPTGGFGLRRILNGQPRSPHTGFDWAAPAGTAVLAANAGRVTLVAEHFFAGRNVVVDHGLGLFTLYFHLSEVQVAVGDAVTAGQVLGAVGATGRVTGAHLHFAVLLSGARVDPESLLAVAPPPDLAP